MHTAIGILAALLQRAQRTGVGSVVDVSIHEAAMRGCVPSRAMFTAADAIRDLPCTANACYNVYETADGQWLALGALEPKFWTGFCERIGRPDLGRAAARQGDERARVARATCAP